MVKENRDILQRILQLMFAITLLFIPAVKNAFAETLSTEEIRALLKETRALRKEVAQLKKELAEHKREHADKPIVRSTQQLPSNPQKKQVQAQKVFLQKPIIAPAARETVNANQNTRAQTSKDRAVNKNNSLSVKDYVRRLGGISLLLILI